MNTIKNSKFYLIIGFFATFLSNYLIVLSSSKYKGYWSWRASDLYLKLTCFSFVEFALLSLLLPYLIPKFIIKLEQQLLSVFGISFVISTMFYGSSRTCIIITSLIFCLSVAFTLKNKIKETN
jgi:hypothetical protein